MRNFLLVCTALLCALTFTRRSAGLSETLTEPAEIRVKDANVTSVTLSPYDFFEDCLTLRAGERLGYSFESSAQLYFNLHYHNAQDEAVYPVPDYLSSGAAAQFSPELEAYYCLMWTNPTNERLELSFHYAK